MAEKINCFHCAHYHVTWDPKFPRGCRALRFKGHEMPSAVVLRSSGMECQMFTPKDRQGDAEKERA
ncbi:MAG: uracil-DNA glycosylase [Thermodesulfobacteriota bacterium]